MNSAESVQAKHVGARTRRLEDPRMLTGQATYVDDIWLHGMLHMDVLRSPHAHARIVKIDLNKARALPGVVAVYTGEELSHFLPALPSACGLPGLKVPEHHALAREIVASWGRAWRWSWQRIAIWRVTRSN